MITYHIVILYTYIYIFLLYTYVASHKHRMNPAKECVFQRQRALLGSLAVTTQAGGPWHGRSLEHWEDVGKTYGFSMGFSWGWVKTAIYHLMMGILFGHIWVNQHP